MSASHRHAKCLDVCISINNVFVCACLHLCLDLSQHLVLGLSVNLVCACMCVRERATKLTDSV